ncbi:hypothetical protein WL29_08150 [Burkholderia ubonensis]|uniref:Uncharacterized protein n=1 Tax=Burkholderia ubonensis TaxID=101571 RepID=A0A106PLN5_9BURK|nr:hypothetical protein WL29_08150 [Burkholderia ubonensis]
MIHGEVVHTSIPDQPCGRVRVTFRRGVEKAAVRVGALRFGILVFIGSVSASCFGSSRTSSFCKGQPTSSSASGFDSSNLLADQPINVTTDTLEGSLHRLDDLGVVREFGESFIACSNGESACSKNDVQAARNAGSLLQSLREILPILHAFHRRNDAAKTFYGRHNDICGSALFVHGVCSFVDADIEVVPELDVTNDGAHLERSFSMDYLSNY